MRLLDEVVTRTLKRLEDSTNRIWSRAEITNYLQIGYDELCRATRCLWDVIYLENLPYCANHTAQWEEEYMTDPGDSIQGIFNYTGGAGNAGNTTPWEQAYVDNGIGPCMFTAPWEAEYTYAPGSTSLQDEFASISQLPKTLLDVDRVTYDYYRINPSHSADLNAHFRDYEYVHGPTRGYVLDKDGFFSFRKVPIPSGRADAYDFTGATYGLLRKQTASDLETSPVIQGSYGIMRRAPLHLTSGTYGFPRRIYQDGKNVRVEHFRRSKQTLDQDAQFEIPDRYVKYVEMYAMARAREREGPGQDLKLSEHFDGRFLTGIRRLLHRTQTVERERISRMGSGSFTGGAWPAMAQLPYHYPRVPYYRR